MHLSYVRLLVERFADSFRFYRDSVGLEVLWGSEADGYAEFQVGLSTRLALCARHIVAEIPGASGTPATGADRFMLVIEVKDVDARVAELKGRGVEFLVGPTDRPVWTVRTAHLRDPEGNLIEINQPLAGR